MSRDISVDTIKKEISIQLYEIGGIKFGDFTLTSGKKSPYYIDLRLVPSYPKLFDKFADICFKIITEELKDIDRLVGVPTSGLPFSALVAHKAGLPLLYTRKQSKGHGLKKAIEGVLENNDRVCIIDDVATTGGSIRSVSNTLRSEGAVVEDAVVMFDRSEGANESLEKIGLHLKSCLEISELISHLRGGDILDDSRYSLVEEYLDDLSG